jgi:hypothetical protein
MTLSHSGNYLTIHNAKTKNEREIGTEIFGKPERRKFIVRKKVFSS